MTPDVLRAEAEEVALRIVQEVFGDLGGVTARRELAEKVTNALVAFARQHAAHAVEVARLEGKIAALESAESGEKYGGYDIGEELKSYRAELAALRGGKETDRASMRGPWDYKHISNAP